MKSRSHWLAFLFVSVLTSRVVSRAPPGKDPRWTNVVQATPSSACISAPEDLEPLLRNLTYHADMERQRKRGAFNRTHLWQLVDRNTGWDQEANESLAIRSKRLVMIRNNTFFSPWLVSSERPLAGRILWTFEFLHLAMTRHNLSFPDTVFYIEEDDSCIACTPHNLPVPALTWFRHQPTYQRVPNIDEDINDLFLLAPVTSDVDLRLFSFPWDKKVDTLFFRGGNFCHPPENIAENLEEDFGLKDDNDFCNNCARRFFFTPDLYGQYGNVTDCQLKPGRIDERAVQATYKPRYFDPQFYSIRDHARFKYVLSLDGLTVSHRFAKLLHTDSVVLKETSGWEEYFYPALTPWVHYVPVLNGTIWDAFYIVSNATGADVQERLRQIALNGQAFAAKYLCHRGRALYWQRLLQDYRGLFGAEGREMDEFIHEVESSRGYNVSALQPFDISAFPQGWGTED